MGHTRLGTVPKTRKWNELIEQIAGPGLTGNVATAAVNISAIAARTLDAAQKGLDKAVDDPSVRYTFYLLTQVALASRTSDWEGALSEHGISLSNDSTVFEFTAQVQDAIDRNIRRDPAGATDLSEISLAFNDTRSPSGLQIKLNRYLGPSRRLIVRCLSAQRLREPG